MTGAKTVRPNAFHRAFHRLLMLRPVTAILIRVLHRADMLIWKLNGGQFSVTGLLSGVPTFQVTTIGAKTHLGRTLPLAGFQDGERIALIASNFGQARNPAWYRNLKVNSQCWVLIHGKEKSCIAHEAEGQEYQRFWNMAVAYYPGYAVYKTTAGARRIPIMVLEPEKKQLPES